jgi:hypothetical protein
MEQINQNEELDFNNVLDEFRTAVFNGQVRLALEHLVTIVDVFVEVLSSEEENKEPTKEESVKNELVMKEDKRETPLVAEEKPVTPKKNIKETAEKTEE